jgi:uncharacterized protein YjbI with pentapeptide repeats
MGANLRDAKLFPANLEGADHSAASILNAKLQDANLEGANLDGARLAGADLDDTTASRQDGEIIVASTAEVAVNAGRRNILASLLLTALSRVLKAVLELEEWLPSTPFGDCLRIFLCLPVLIGVGWALETFFDTSIADMTYCLENDRNAQLLGVDTSRRDLTQMDVSNAEPAGANLREANLFGANLVRPDPSHTNLCGANLGAAILEAAHQEGARLKSARLAGAKSNNGAIMPEGWEDIVASKPEDEPN